MSVEPVSTHSVEADTDEVSCTDPRKEDDVVAETFIITLSGGSINLQFWGHHHIRKVDPPETVV